jgi:hypothetical protein
MATAVCVVDMPNTYDREDADHLVLAGQVTEQCILLMKRNMRAEPTPCAECKLEA